MRGGCICTDTIIPMLPTITAPADTITMSTMTMRNTAAAVTTTMSMRNTAAAVTTIMNITITAVAVMITTATEAVPAAMITVAAVVAAAMTILIQKGISGSWFPVRSCSSWAC